MSVPPSDDPSVWIHEMETLINSGRRSLLPQYVLHGPRDEASRRFNVCVFLDYTTVDTMIQSLRHVLFEDENVDEEEIEEVLVAVHLEEAFFGAYQLSLGNEWGKKIIANALEELDGMSMSARALLLAQALTNMVKKGGTIEEPEEEAVLV